MNRLRKALSFSCFGCSQERSQSDESIANNDQRNSPPNDTANSTSSGGTLTVAEYLRSNGIRYFGDVQATFSQSNVTDNNAVSSDCCPRKPTHTLIIDLGENKGEEPTFTILLDNQDDWKKK